VKVGFRSFVRAAGLRGLAGAAVVAATAMIVSARAAEPSAAGADWNRAAIGTIDPKVFDMALGAEACAIETGAVSNPATLSVIDYSKASTIPRLWVYDLKNRSLLYQELVAHGQGSGGNVASRFSNESDTHASSLGLFVTAGTVVASTGYSLLLNGLEAGINDHALARGIIMHGAWYVSEAFAKAQGYLGRSWGCPAVSLQVARTLIDRIKGGGLLFAYYPDPRWLATSRFLNHCGAKPATASTN